jgi:uncharacterized membrane protein
MFVLEQKRVDEFLIFTYLANHFWSPATMLPIHYSLLVHFVGLGLIFTSIIAGWILTGHYKRSGDWNAKSIHVRSLRAIGLLSPIGVLVMLVSGIGNMTLGPRPYTLFSDSWLSTKLVLVVLLVAAGVFFGIKSGHRTKLVHRVAAGSAPGDAEETIRALDRQQRWFYVLEAVLLLIILVLSIVKPN